MVLTKPVNFRRCEKQTNIQELIGPRQKCRNRKVEWVNYVRKFMERNDSIPQAWYGKWWPIIHGYSNSNSGSNSRNLNRSRNDNDNGNDNQMANFKRHYSKNHSLTMKLKKKVIADIKAALI